MPRTSRDGRDLKRWLEYRLNRDVPAVEIATALGVSESTYSRRKNAPDFPDYDQFGMIAAHFDQDPIALRLEFGIIDEDELRNYLNMRSLTLTKTEAETEAEKPAKTKRPKRRANPARPL